ncbi:MAG: FHA domain-containing protein [Candidatus Sumerlaeaceae bacterium]|nr:FHA domain-containing protein [Candidatus Sumerlaeaceae bacterium]
MPELILKLGDTVVQRYVFDKDIISIGRSRDNDIVVDNLSVSRNHARLRRQNGKYILTDLNSANGTYVNNVRVSKTEIADNDVITLGKYTIQFLNTVLSDEELIVDALGADRTVVVERTPQGVLAVTKGKLAGKEFSLTKTETTIGKAPNNDIVITDDWFMSKKQAVIRALSSGYELQDYGSYRKTRLNGAPLQGPVRLKPGDVIEFGSTRCEFRLAEEPLAPPATGRVPRELAAEDSIFSGVAPAPPAAEPQAAEFEVPVEESPVPDEETPEPVESPAADAALARIGSDEAPEEPAEIDEPSQPMGRGKRHKLRQRRGERGEEYHTVEFSSRGTSDTGAQPADAVQQALAGEVEAQPVPVSEAAGLSGPAEDYQVPHRPLPDREQEIAIWEKALQNKSPLIRKRAAEQLRKLTGREYAT